MSQPCSVVELVLFDARGLADPKVRADVASIVDLGLLTGAVMDDDRVAETVDTAGFAEQLQFWFGSSASWPFERAIAFANVEPGRVLFVSSDRHTRDLAEQLGLQVHDPVSGDVLQRIP